MPTIPTTALDTTLASLAAATTEVVIGCKTATSGLHCDSPSWRDSTSWDGIRKAGPAVFDITAGDKIKFVYSYEHNVWWLPEHLIRDTPKEGMKVHAGEWVRDRQAGRHYA